MGENREDDPLPVRKQEEPELIEAEAVGDEPDEGGEGDEHSGRVTGELTVTRTVEQFSGPLPHPQLLKGYNDAFAGCAERVVAMVERQSAHRQQIERMVIESNCNAQSRGQWFAFILGFLVIGGGIYLLAEGRSIEGFSAIILAVGSLIGALIYGRSEQRKERENKSRPSGGAPKEATPPAKR